MIYRRKYVKLQISVRLVIADVVSVPVLTLRCTWYNDMCTRLLPCEHQPCTHILAGIRESSLSKISSWIKKRLHPFIMQSASHRGGLSSVTSKLSPNERVVSKSTLHTMAFGDERLQKCECVGDDPSSTHSNTASTRELR